MHLCPDEIMAISAAVPFIGYLCLKCRHICTKCANVFRRLTDRECAHHNHAEN